MGLCMEAWVISPLFYYKKVVFHTMKDAYLVTHTKNVQQEYRKEGKCQKRKMGIINVGRCDEVQHQSGKLEES